MPATHPLVRTHPVTDRRSLFLSRRTILKVSELGADESQALLAELIAHATEQSLVYRHRCRAHDVIMWDNRCTMHAVEPYKASAVRRITHRTTLAGDIRPSS